MLDDAEHARWRATADEQLRVARLLAREGVNASAVFHAEQAAQCALKAVLHGLGQPGRGHGLVDLSDRVSAATGLEPDDETVDSVQLLAQSYMPSRYPDACPRVRLRSTTVPPTPRLGSWPPGERWPTPSGSGAASERPPARRMQRRDP